MGVYQAIDRFPELPYFAIAVVYSMTHPIDILLHVLSAAFIFMVSAVGLGLILKVVLGTSRPTDYSHFSAFRYDVPSLHSLVSVGSIVFVYFVDPAYSIVVVPLGLLYTYSRLRLSVHTKTAVWAGALIGLIVGWVFGANVWNMEFLGLERTLTAMFFLVPVAFSISRILWIRSGRHLL